MEKKKYHIVTYGCQMNVHESEKLAGIMRDLGYEETIEEENADAILFNTCCIRENAEERAYGNIGALKNLKRRKKDLIIAVGGCMTQQNGAAEKLKKTFPFVDIVFGTHNLEDFKRLFEKKLATKKSVLEIEPHEGAVTEGTPKYRTSYPNAWVNIMYGCNNFCTYCIVPYVRGRERSRKADDIVEECKKLIAEGYKEITLLGQNVNSYGNDFQDGEENFAKLISRIASLDGKFRLRFMTNHPKDLSREVARAIQENPKICRAVHLPVQSGSNRILKAMNRHYTKAQYLKLIEKARELMPDILFTSDIIVGFPGETYEDFKQTVSLIEQVRYQSLYTFIYSKRHGTPAENMPDPVTRKEKGEWMRELLEVQESIAEEICAQQVGKRFVALAEEPSKNEGMLYLRTLCNQVVEAPGSTALIGQFVNIEVTSGETWILKAKIID